MSTDTHLFLKYRCEKGLVEKGLDKDPQYRSRMEFELDVIERTTFSGYFLVVSDLLSWARTNKILHGPGRGSVGGSLVAYLLGITQLDPIKYRLYFERFLSVGRVKKVTIDFPEYTKTIFDKS